MTSGGAMNGGGVITGQIPFLDLAPMTSAVRDDVDRGLWILARTIRSCSPPAVRAL